ncbi:MAG: ABC transporter permease [Chryseolinea sp.]
MFRNYLLVAFRNLLRHKMFSTINIVGLALGMTSTLFLLNYVSFELSYDKSHQHLKDIYMIRLDSWKDNVFEGSSMASFYAEAPAIKDQYSQVQNFVRLHTASGMISYQDERGETLNYFEPNGYYADSSFFSVFSFPLIMGEKQAVLKTPKSMLISESGWKKYFGNVDPIGKVMKLTGWESGEYVVEGVFKDVPENSHIHFDFLFSIENLLKNEQFKNSGWYWENFNTYLLLKPNTDMSALQSGVDQVMESKLGTELRKDNSTKKLALVPLSDVHLYSSMAYTNNGNCRLVYFILVVACLVLCIAWVNYLILSTAAAVQRSKEIGIRKVLGSERIELVKQFLVESFFVSTLAILITGGLLIIFNPYFTDLVGKKIALDLITQGKFWLIVVGAMLSGIFLCGFYPGVMVSTVQSITALKGGYERGDKGERARKIMVVLQFVACIILIASTLTIREQLVYMHDQPTGIDMHQKLILRAPLSVPGDSRLSSINAFKNLLTQQPSIRSVASSSEVPGRPIGWAKEFKLVQQSDAEKQVLHVLSVDEDFIKTYGLTLVAGRNFSQKFPRDFGGAVIINETALERLGIQEAENAIDQEVVDFLPQRIIGVVKDYQQQSLKEVNVPIVFQFIPWNNDYFTISIQSQNLRAEVQRISELYKTSFPGNPVDYYFLDDFMNKLYESDEQFWKIFRLFSILTIFISCLGLFGLSSFIISRRSKEIGIRKVLGSSVSGIVVLLSFDFMKIIGLAFVLAVPIVMLVMDKWLESFAHRIQMPIWIYLSSGGIALLVAMITVSWQTIKAASTEPIATIRIN